MEKGLLFLLRLSMKDKYTKNYIKRSNAQADIKRALELGFLKECGKDMDNEPLYCLTKKGSDYCR